MSKQPNKKDLHEKAEAFVAEKQMAYSDAITAARAASETTNTPAWLENYAIEMESHQRVINGHCDVIVNSAKFMQITGVDEEQEKAIKTEVKGLSEERIRHDAWHDRTVYPYSSKVDTCKDILKSIAHDARDAEDKNPLVYRGFADAVAEITNTWPKAHWDKKTGIVKIDEGGQAELMRENA